MSKSSDNLQIVNFRITPEEIARLDRCAELAGVTRSQFLRNLVLVGTEEFETMRKMGLIHAALTVRDILEWMGAKAKSGAEHIDKDRSIKA